MKILDLFSGIGGISLGLERAGMTTEAFCEFDPHAEAILKKHWPETPIYKDVRTLDAKQYRGTVDVVCGGFPCQDLSTAGTQAGFSGERSSLYREMLRIISECMPKYAIFENVANLIAGEQGRWFAQFLYDLAQIGYDAEWHCIPASYVGAPHHRDRVWIIAYPSNWDDRNSEHKQDKRQKQESGESTSTTQVLTDTDAQRRERSAKIAHHIKQQIELMRSSETVRERFNLSQPPLCGADDGIPRRLDRLRRLGNAVVPVIPEAIGKAIMEYENGKEESQA